MDGVVIYGRGGFYLSPLAAIGFTHLFEPGKSLSFNHLADLR